ncbi:hypothetical protein JCM6882_008623 [Rhodosporidiobolus microsporus]
MADKPLNPQGKSYGLAWCVAHPGKGDELEKLLVMAGQSGRSSELEPFCDEFRVFRFGDEFRLLEIFDETKGGVTEHQNSKAFNEVGSRTDIVASRGMRFYEEVKF